MGTAKELNDVYGQVEHVYQTHEASAACKPLTAEEYIARLPDETDYVNEPPHYNHGTIECIDYIQDILSEDEYIGYLRGNITKYHHRLMFKGSPKENAQKMRWYLDKLIEVL